jgi:hypothetical protein
MRLNQTTTLNSFQQRIAPDGETPTFNDDLGGGSNIVEPDIITPIAIQVEAPIKGGNVTNVEQVEAGLELPNDIRLNDVKESSATTEENKTYVSGGTTPDSNIVLNKPKPNYLVYGIIGVIGALVIYKVFFKKKIS